MKRLVSILRIFFSANKCPDCGKKIGSNEAHCNTCREYEYERQVFSF